MQKYNLFLLQGKTTIIQNESWVYCALSPALGHGHVNGTQFGLGPENDLLSAYNSAFGMSADEYRILTVCIYEVSSLYFKLKVKMFHLTVPNNLALRLRPLHDPETGLINGRVRVSMRVQLRSVQQRDQLWPLSFGDKVGELCKAIDHPEHIQNTTTENEYQNDFKKLHNLKNDDILRRSTKILRTSKK
jgi:hypothetical protein